MNHTQTTICQVHENHDAASERSTGTGYTLPFLASPKHFVH